MRRLSVLLTVIAVKTACAVMDDEGSGTESISPLSTLLPTTSKTFSGDSELILSQSSLEIYISFVSQPTSIQKRSSRELEMPPLRTVSSPSIRMTYSELEPTPTSQMSQASTNSTFFITPSDPTLTLHSASSLLISSSEAEPIPTLHTASSIFTSLLITATSSEPSFTSTSHTGPSLSLKLTSMTMSSEVKPTPTSQTTVSSPISPSPTSQTTSLTQTSQTTSPSPTSRTASPSPTSRTASPSPTSRTASPSPTSQTTSLTQTSQTASPSPTSRTASPSPTSRTASPSPTSQTTSLTQTSQTASPSPTSRTASPSPTSRTASPSPTSRTASPSPTPHTTSPHTISATSSENPTPTPHMGPESPNPLTLVTVSTHTSSHDIKFPLTPTRVTSLTVTESSQHITSTLTLTSKPTSPMSSEKQFSETSLVISPNSTSQLMSPISTISTQRSSISFTTTRTQMTVTPSEQPTPETAFYTHSFFLIAVTSFAAILLLVGCLFLPFALHICRKRCYPGCRCPCCRRYPNIEGPIIAVSYRSSYHGDRESYYIRTNELGPTTFYPRRGEDDASMEFTAAFYASASRGESAQLSSAPKTRENNTRNVTFSSLQREHQAFAQQLKVHEGEESEETDDELNILELDNLERVLDSALVKFETTTL